MIAVITSCINPKDEITFTKSYFSLEEREAQTLKTINELSKIGFSQIILADNSYKYDFSKLQLQNKNLKIIHFQQYQFENKSINEILILLSTLAHIPAATKIFKISGRYFPTDNFRAHLDDNIDFKVKGFDFDSNRPVISTRGYFVKNKVIYEQFLLSCLNEIYSYPYRVVGFRSFWIFLIDFVKPKLRTMSYISVEFAAARVLKKGSFKYQLTDILHIEGQIAGLQTKELIKE